MVFSVMPGTGSQEGMFLVVEMNGTGDMGLAKSFEDELDALTYAEEMNGEDRSIEYEKVPAEMSNLLAMLA